MLELWITTAYALGNKLKLKLKLKHYGCIIGLKSNGKYCHLTRLIRNFINTYHSCLCTAFHSFSRMYNKCNILTSLFFILVSHLYVYFSQF